MGTWQKLLLKFEAPEGNMRYVGGTERGQCWSPAQRGEGRRAQVTWGLQCGEVTFCLQWEPLEPSRQESHMRLMWLLLAGGRRGDEEGREAHEELLPQCGRARTVAWMVRRPEAGRLGCILEES